MTARDTIDSLPDPAALADRSDVTVERETPDVPREHFEHWRERAGLVGVGATTDDDRLLLWDGPHGWTLPYAEVDTGEDFAAVARDALATLLGVTPALVAVERATDVVYSPRDGDGETTAHEVVFRTAALADDTAAELVADADDLRLVADVNEAAVADENTEDVEGEAADVRLFLG
jgi:hypothetical protein